MTGRKGHGSGKPRTPDQPSEGTRSPTQEGGPNEEDNKKEKEKEEKDAAKEEKDSHNPRKEARAAKATPPHKEAGRANPKARGGKQHKAPAENASKSASKGYSERCKKCSKSSTNGGTIRPRSNSSSDRT